MATMALDSAVSLQPAIAKSQDLQPASTRATNPVARLPSGFNAVGAA